MKKVFVILVSTFIFIVCDNGGMGETNPYPDGVYPFEVTGVGHTLTNMFNYAITWTPPVGNGFTGVQANLFLMGSNPSAEYLVYSSVTGLDENWDNPPGTYGDFVIKKDSFSFVAKPSNNHYVIIKCVDKFGNVSEGVKYEFSSFFPH
jgi:hypothetical protein